MKILLLSLLYCELALATSGAKLLIGSDDSLNLKSVLTTQISIKLDNPFKLQAYANLKNLMPVEQEFENWMMSILNDQDENALRSSNAILAKVNAKIQPLYNFSMAYLYWKQNLSQLFINKWFELSAQNSLSSELAIALDQFISNNATDWLKKHHIILSFEQMKHLELTKSIDLRFHNLLQAFNHRNQGEKSLEWVSKLNDTDSFKRDLIYAAILFNAKNGKLALSGKLIQEGIEPLLEGSQDVEEISYYYLTLARLLYQARAFKESLEYYSLIPDKSQYFLSARMEKIWAYLQLNDLSKAQAEVQSLKHPIFHDRFLPDVYLTSAIVNLKTCQFLEVQKDINSFVEVNAKWPKLVEENLKSKNPTMLNSALLSGFQKRLEELKEEGQKIHQIWGENATNSLYVDFTQELQNRLTRQIHAQWGNRQKLLDDAIYRMKFVRIELLSQMRNLALNIPLSNTDQVSTYHAAPARHGALVFPSDGQIWGDDLFSMMAQVQNLCLKGLKQ